jgi:NADPH:quinone reductase-like Zn-dependent oxidoreductase
VKAIVWTRYGPPTGLQIAEVPKPIPGDHELLIRIRATTVTAGDCELRGLRFSLGLRVLVRMVMGPLRPRHRILGQELAGDVEAVGAAVRRFGVGDAVFGTTGFGFGAYAEYICLPERPTGAAVGRKPTNMSYEEAASVPTGGLEALHFLRRAGLLRGQRVLIVGAGGGIGRFAVQLAKCFGAHVTGVDRAEKADLLRSLGADRVIDFNRQDFAQLGDTYDVIFDIVGGSRFSDCLRILNDGGRYLLGNATMARKFRGRWASFRGSKKVVVAAAAQNSEDLAFLADLIEKGSVRAVVDRRYALPQVPEAHRYFETGEARGSVVVTV